MNSRVFRVLFVCTGNLCRSPTAEIITRHLITDAMAPRGAPIEMISAGTAAIPGRRIATATGAALARLGLGEDARAFRSRRFDADLAERADLVLTAERAHRSVVVTTVPTALRRTFTIREFARLITGTAPPAGTDPADRARAAVRLAARARGTQGYVPEELDAIGDPIRLPLAAHRATVEVIAHAVGRFAEFLTGTEMAPGITPLLDTVTGFPHSPTG